MAELPEGAQLVIGAAIGLHNVCVDNKDELPDDVREALEGFQLIMWEHVDVVDG